MKSDMMDKKSAFDKAYGAWDDNDKAEELDVYL